MLDRYSPDFGAGRVCFASRRTRGPGVERSTTPHGKIGDKISSPRQQKRVRTRKRLIVGRRREVLTINNFIRVNR